MANIPGTNVASPITPFTTNDDYATHDSKYGKGGHRTVNTIVERNAIPYKRRELLMTVAVIEDGKTYKLSNNPVAAVTDNSCWSDAIINNVTDIIPASGNLLFTGGNLYKSSDITTAFIDLISNTRYSKVLWCLEVGTVLPTLTFADTIIWRYDNDLELMVNSYNVYEFETWDGGIRWLGKVSKYNIAKPERDMTEEDVESMMNWETI